jgi:hypothetical protein
MWIKKIEMIIIFIIIIQKLNTMLRMFQFCPRNEESESDSEYEDSVGIQIYSEIEETLPTNHKAVRFSEKPDIYIIPNMDTYSNDKYTLWWSSNDLTIAQSASYKEVLQFIKIYPNTHFKNARKAIYHSAVYFDIIYYQE